MRGKITFRFDDGHLSHYEQVFPLFQEMGYYGCLALPLNFSQQGMNLEQALKMQAAGWEIQSHSVDHCSMNMPLPYEQARRQIADSRTMLEVQGFHIRQFVTPCSACDVSHRELLQAHYDAAYTIYTSAARLPVEDLVMARPVNQYALHGACMAGKALQELQAYVDYVVEHDAWLVLYDHDIGQGNNITLPCLKALLSYCRQVGVAVMTSSQALDAERCRTRIISEGFDGKQCIVHTRGAAHHNERLLTAQHLDLTGNDAFECIHVNYSADGGKTWSGFTPDPVFASIYHESFRTIPSDMTPHYHQKTGAFFVTGHTVDYFIGQNHPVPPLKRRRTIPYAVFDPETKRFGPLQMLQMPDPVKFSDCGSGCSQCCELENGDILLPVSFQTISGGEKQNARVMVLRCVFDGTDLKVISCSNEIVVDDSVRGIGESSILCHQGSYYLTIRDDQHGYLSVSSDGSNFSAPQVWRWDDGEIVPTYNTQQHWFSLGNQAYLVYTRKNSSNEHVFRHRAPLYAAEFDPERCVLKRATEFIVVPERGARLGNFGVCNVDAEHALVIASEWMQPVGCEVYGSNNAVWITEIPAAHPSDEAQREDAQ